MQEIVYNSLTMINRRVIGKIGKKIDVKMLKSI